ncbi:MAG: hypothetical protein HQL30_09750, partial [Candidatus Omnitrophica bacterium]|nr:hypothetical protein [Candidatus Omnitrophota bacterium]
REMFVEALLWVLYRTPDELRPIKQVIRMTAEKYSIKTSAEHMIKIYEDVRSKRTVSAGKKNSSRYLFLWRLRAEWDIYWNFIRSVAASIFKGNFLRTEQPAIIDTAVEPPKIAAGLSAIEVKPDLYVMTEDGKRIAFSLTKGGFDRIIIIAHGFYN